MTSPSASWSYQPSPYYYKVISVNSVHRFSRFSGEVKRLCHVSVLVRQVPKPASPYFAAFHKGKVRGGKCRAGALSCWLALPLILQPYIWFLQTDVFWKWIYPVWLLAEWSLSGRSWGAQQQRRRFRISIQLLLRAAQFNPDRDRIGG